MKIAKWLNVFVLATTVTFVLGCEPAGETTGTAPATTPEGSSGTGGGAPTPGGGDMATPPGDETAPAADEPVADEAADAAPADE